MSKLPLVWPPFATDPAAPIARWATGLGSSQTWSAQRLLVGQQQQLQALARWAQASTPFYRDHARWRGPLQKLVAATPANFADRWRDLPIVAKADLRLQGPRFNSVRLPPGEEPADALRTSGSTGMPVEIKRSATARRMWQALTLREAYWQGRDLGARLGVARYLSKTRRGESGEVFPNWGPPFTPLHATGPRAVIHVGHSLDILDRWLEAARPQILLTYPSVLAGLMDRREGRPPPGLVEASLISEPVSDALAERLKQDWSTKATQAYSAIDGGYLALQCELGRLHVQSEAVYVELLRDDDQPCSPGETGRVVLTPLHNFATPLLRYSIGDYATAGGSCACGREHPVIDRVLGRERNLVRRPDGSVGWPEGMGAVRKVAAVQQAQFVQTALDHVDVRVKLSRPLREGEHETLVGIVRRVLGYPFDVGIVEVQEVERGPTGKFEEFVSRLDAVPVRG